MYLLSEIMRGSQLGEQSYLAVERPKKLGR